MGKKGPTRHLKREASPRIWPIPRKRFVWAPRTSPGPHPIDESIPLLIMVRDILGYAETGREARIVIKEGQILVDGRTRRDIGFPVGIMDVVEIPKAGQAFRVLPASRERLRLHPIGEEELRFKLCRIIGKTTIKGGRTQLNLHDGRNILLEDGGSEYKLNDVIKLSIPDQEILDHVRFEKGARALVIGGGSRGMYGLIVELRTEPWKRRTAVLKIPGREEITTLARYLFAVGSEKPLISLPGGE
ncbi:MAG: 30S ribosomal protein S4e [Candidatus Bathyarchaeia archaeon]|nr:30S ribosomal protein S4e [Candidatus Bathyarchaeota archaeon]